MSSSLVPGVTRRIVYAQPAHDWKGFQRDLTYEPPGTHKSVVITVDHGGTSVPCRLDASDIEIADDDSVAFIIHHGEQIALGFVEESKGDIIW